LGSLEYGHFFLVHFYNKADAPISDIGFNETEHLLSSSCCLDENTVVDLKETQKLEDLSWLGGDLIDTEDRLSKFVGVAIKTSTHPRIRMTK
jgi:hypothetical protein